MTKATMLKKLLAICLALMFILSMPGVSTIVEAASSGAAGSGRWETNSNIDLGDKTYDGYIVVTGGNVTISNGTIDASKWNTSAITVQGGANVILKNVTVTGGKGTPLISELESRSRTIEASKLYGSGYNTVYSVNTTSGLNAREEPTNGTPIKTLPNGTIVVGDPTTITAADKNGNKWIKIVTDSIDGECWVAINYLKQTSKPIPSFSKKYTRVGGGVFVANGKLYVEDRAVIENNTAERGGGIFVNQGATLTMTGGEVRYNKTIDENNGTGKNNFAGEGGGIFVWGTATIYGGKIINNTCNSSTDLGGGGLYVNNGGKATLKNAKITNNTAKGLGGGIAGCCHGEMSLVAIDGCALYGNTAMNTNGVRTINKSASEDFNDVVDHYDEALKANMVGRTENGSVTDDFFTAGACIVSNYMAGGGNERYTAVVSGQGGNKPFEIDDAKAFKYTTEVALKANPSEESKKLVPTDGVEISGNYSTVHGGGVGCNGGLYFGSSESQQIIIRYLGLDLPVTKTLNGVTPQDGLFTAELYFAEDVDMTTGKIKANAKPLATVINKDGKFTFKLNEYKTFADKIGSTAANTDEKIKSYSDGQVFNAGTLNLVVKEKEKVVDGKKEKNYDYTLYKVDLPLYGHVQVEEETIKHTTNSNNTFKDITVKYISVTYNRLDANSHKADITVTKLTDRNGVTLAEPEAVPSGIVFDNYDSKDLTLTKQVIDSQKKNSEAEGNNVDTEKKFKFTIEFSTNKDLVAGRSFDAVLAGVNTSTGIIPADGKVTVELSDGQTYTIKGLPQTVDYTITEDTDNDYTSDKANNTVTGSVGAGGASETFVNTRKSGSLKVTKTVVQTNGNTNPKEDFEFTVTLGLDPSNGKPVTGTFDGVTFTTVYNSEGSATGSETTFTLKDGESKTITGLPANVPYTVTESHDDYTTEFTGNTSGTITADGAEVTATNTRKVGKLSLTKKVNSIQDNESKDDEFTFTVTVYERLSGAYSTEKTAVDDTTTSGVVTFTPNIDKRIAESTANVTVKADETVTILGLPVGATYTVTEDLSTRPEYEQVSIEPNTGTILEGETGVTVTATNKKKDGSLTVTKTVELGETKNAVSVYGLSEEEFTFTVELGLGYDGKPVIGTFGGVPFAAKADKPGSVGTFTLKDGQSKTISGLPAGVSYTVTETANGKYETSWTGETGKIPTGGTATVEAVNTRKTGSLKLTKTINDEIDQSKLVNKTYTFIIKSLTDKTLNGTFTLQNDENPPVAVGVAEFENGTAKVEVAAGETVTITGLPTGTYNVTEDEVDQKDPIVYKVETEVAGKKETVNEEWTFAGVTGDGNVEVTADGEAQTVVASVEITNRYTRKAQFFPTVTKIVEGPARVDKEIKTFVFKLYDETGAELGTATVTDNGSEGFQQNVPFYSPEGNLVVIDYSEIGVHNYTIKEVDNNNDPFFTYDKSTWNVQVFVENSDGDDKLEVRCAYTNGTDSYIGKGAAVTFTNVYAPTGSIAVTKTVEGIRPGDLNRTFTVTVTGLGKNSTLNGEFNLARITTTATDGEKTFGAGAASGKKAVFANGVAEFTISADETVQIDGLPYGDYSVVENTAAADDVKIEHYNFLPETSITSATVKVDAANLETVESAALINRYEARPGSLSVTKEVTGTYKTNPKYDPDSEEFVFDITVTGAEGAYEAVKNARITDEIDGDKFVTVSPVNTTVTFANGKATVSLKAGETITINGLPYGAEYTVTETNHIDGYDAPVYTNASGTITSDVTATVTVTNNRDSGSLKIFKNVADIPNAAIAYTEFTFRITGPEGFDMRTTVKGASAFEINGLIPGEYTITEITDNVKTIKFTDADGVNGEWTLKDGDHSVTVTVKPDEFNAEGKNIALATGTITNTYTDKLGSISLEKKFEFVDGTEEEFLEAYGNKKYTFKVYRDYKGDGTDKEVGTIAVSYLVPRGELKGLIPGNYTVVEDVESAEVFGWKLETENVNAEVVAGGIAEKSVTNTYTKLYGDLELIKEPGFTDGSDRFELADTDLEFVFEVTGPDGNTTEVKLNKENNFKETVKDIPVGTYTIKETKTDNVKTVKIGDKVWHLEEGTYAATADVVSKETTEVAVATITNIYKEELGSLTIKKDIDFNSNERPTEEDLNKYSFDFEIKNNETNDVVYATVVGEGEFKVENLKPGTYTVTELFGESNNTPTTITSTDATGVTRNWTITTEGNHSAVVTVTVGEEATIAVATVTNVYEEQLASLTIRKIVEVDETASVVDSETDDEGETGESEVTTAPENEPEVTTTPEPEVTTVSETEAQPAMGSDVEAYAAPAEVPEVTTASESEPELTTTPEPEVTTAPESEPEVATSSETEADVTVSSESEAEVTTASETEADVTTVSETEADVTTASETESEEDFVTDPATGESVPVKVYLITREYTFDITGPNGYSNTVTINGNNETTLEGLIPGVYNIKERDSDATGWHWYVSGDGDIKVNSGSDNTATVVNSYSKTLPQSGSLTINKTVVGGGEAAANATYVFDIETVVSDPVIGQHRVVIDTVELSAINSWSRTLYNLAPGQYIITERNADIPGYDLEVIADGTAEVKLGTNTAYNVTNRYTEKRGKLVITKTVEGGGDEAASKTYYFEITDPYGLKRIVSVVGNSFTEVDNLAWGTYTVKEMGADVDGFVLVEVTGEGTATLSAEQLVANIDITNKYEELGKLTLTKNYLGLDGLTPEEIANLSFTFNVTNSDETYSNTVILNAENNWTVTLTKLQPGEYTVSEVEESTKVNGYELINVSGDNVTVSIANNVAENVTITNEYSKLGSLKIEKTVVGGGDAAAGKVYEFEIAGPDGYSNKVTVAANSSVTVDNLKPGTYTIKEVNGDIEGYNLEVTGNGVAVVEVGQNETVVPFTNTYKELGSLTVRKSVAVNGGSIPADKVFYFDITGPDGYSNTLELTANTVKTLDKLVPGEYTVTERTAEAQVSGYSLTVTAEGNSTVPEGGNAEVTVTNTYDQQVGSIEITKKVVGGGATTANKTYTFDITNDATGNTVSVSITGEGNARVDNLVPGSYTVTERDANVEGYRLNVTGEGTVTVAIDGVSPVEITNTYDQIVGSLTITKNVVGGENAGTANKEYTFYVTGPDGYSETVRIIGNGSATLYNLVPGTYNVTEENASIPGYRYEVNGQGDVVVIADTESHITVTNIYTELRNIPVIKEWYINGIRTSAPENAVITVRLYADGVPEGSFITLSAETNWFGSFNDLPVYAEDGHMIVYYVAEDSYYNWIPMTSGDADAGFVISNYTTTTTPDQPDEDQPDEPEPEIDRPEPEVPGPEIPEPDIPLTDIPDEDIPTTEIPNAETPLVDIPDIDIPLFDMVPETGDDSKLALWISLMIASGLGISAILAALLAESKKSKAEKE